TEAIVRLRNISEHFGLPDRELIHPTRTVETASWCRFVLGMHNATHHVEHHLFPSVPFYNLGALRALLVEQPAYLISTHTTRGFRNVLRECMASADLRTTRGSRALIHFDHRTERW
ncbi:fatty acid desaturase, partial [Serpens gallinarum]